jgi:hypothetical protein
MSRISQTWNNLSLAQLPRSPEENAMIDREQLIKERAYAHWLADGSPDGRHEEHWRLAEQEIDSENTGSTDAPNPPEMDSDENGQNVPPARSGRSRGNQKLVESAGSDNPVHHTGQQPLNPQIK